MTTVPITRCLAMLSACLAIPSLGSAGTVNITVGTDGAFEASEIQDAVSFADTQLDGSFDTAVVKIQEGETVPGFSLSATVDKAQLLEISGGWNSSFDTIVAGPDSTVVSALFEGVTVVVDIEILGEGTMGVSNLTITGGSRGLEAVSLSGGDIDLDTLEVHGNTRTESTASSAAGMRLEADGGGSTIVLSSSRIFDNAATTTGSFPATSAGVNVAVSNGAAVLLEDNEIFGNSCNGAGGGSSAQGCGLRAGVIGELAFLIAVGNHVHDNVSNNVGGTEGVNGFLQCSSVLPTALIALFGNRWLGGGGSGASSLEAELNGHCQLGSKTSLIAGSEGAGYRIEIGSTDISASSINDTITANGGDGMVVDFGAAGTLSVANTILFGNGGTDFAQVGGAATVANSLEGIDPLFLSPASGNYSPRPDSPAIDAGTNAPPLPLTDFDIAGRPRIANKVVDIGAYEGPFGLILLDGSESGDTSAWSTTFP